jgi:hypothetical protein
MKSNTLDAVVYQLIESSTRLYKKIHCVYIIYVVDMTSPTGLCKLLQGDFWNVIIYHDETTIRFTSVTTIEHAVSDI